MYPQVEIMRRLLALSGGEPELVADALCRVDAALEQDSGPDRALVRLLQELGRAPGDTGAESSEEGSDEDDDPFPDFDRPPSSSLEQPRESRVPARAAADKDAMLRALVDTLRSYQAVLERHRRDFDQVFERRAQGQVDSEDVTIQRLQEVQKALIKYPVAAQAAFAAIVREGRRYGETAEGQDWQRRLVGSPLLAKARTLFEGVSNGMLAESEGALPSAYVDHFLKALDRDLEDVLGDLGGLGEAE